MSNPNQIIKPLSVGIKEGAPRVFPRITPNLQLRPVQKFAIKAFFTNKKHRRPIITLPTGCGKTILGMAIAGMVSGRILWIAHRDELIEQPAREIQESFPGLDFGILKAAERSGWAKRVCISSIQTLSRKNGTTDALMGGPFSLVIYDECHHATSESARRVLSWLGCFREDGMGPMLLGLTATVERADNVCLSEIFDRVIYSLSIQEAIADGYLVPIKTKKIPLPIHKKSLRIVNGDISESDLDRELTRVNASQATAAAIMAHCEDRKTLVFCVSVDQSKRTAKACQDMGLKAAWVSGTPHMNKRDRRLRLKQLASGAIKILICADLLTEGYDERSINAIVIARPTRSRPRYIQTVGRGLRTCYGKVDCLVLDIVGATDLGLVTADILMEPKEKKPGNGSGGGGGCVTEWDKLSSFLRSAKVDLIEHGNLVFARASDDLIVTVANDCDLVCLRRIPNGDEWEIEHKGTIYTPRPMSLPDVMKICDTLIPEFGGGAKPGSPEWEKGSQKEVPRTPGNVFDSIENLDNPILPIALNSINTKGDVAVNLVKSIKQDVCGQYAKLMTSAVKSSLRDGQTYLYNWDKNPPAKAKRWGWSNDTEHAKPAAKTWIGWIQGPNTFLDPKEVAKLIEEDDAPAATKIRLLKEHCGSTRKTFKSRSREWIRVNTKDVDPSL